MRLSMRGWRGMEGNGQQIDRRTFLKATGVLAGSLIVPGLGRVESVWAQTPPEVLVALGHAVHRRAATGLEESFQRRTGVGRIEWRTFGLGDVHEHLLRGGALPRAAYDLGYLLNWWASRRALGLMEPLNEWLERAPIERFDDFAPGMLRALTMDGRLYGIPMRAVASALHYNEEYFAERGVRVPATIEEFAEAATKLTFTTRAGEKVFGFVPAGLPRIIGDYIIVVARAWDGDVITEDFRVACNEPPVVKALTIYRDLFRGGAVPPDFLSYEVTDQVRTMQMGRAAMTVGPAGANVLYNDPAVSRIAGKARVALIPASREMAGRLEASRSLINFWSFVMPRTGAHKSFVWELIRHLSTRGSQAYSAFVGANDPTRLWLYDQPEFRARVPYADIVKKILAFSRVPWPAFDEVTRTQDIFGREVHRAILGEKMPQRAMDDAAREIGPLLPRRR